MEIDSKLNYRGSRIGIPIEWEPVIIVMLTRIHGAMHTGAARWFLYTLSHQEACEY